MQRTRWDVVVVDEAHHYAHGNRPVRLFAPDGDLRNYDQNALEFDKILALTATPFELVPHELVNLLALGRRLGWLADERGEGACDAEPSSGADSLFITIGLLTAACIGRRSALPPKLVVACHFTACR